MELIDQIVIKADCVEFFLRSLVKAGFGGDKIIDVITRPHHQQHQELFDAYREVEYAD